MRPRETAAAAHVLLCFLSNAASQDVLVEDASLCAIYPGLKASHPQACGALDAETTACVRVERTKELCVLDEADKGVLLTQVVGTRLLTDSLLEPYDLKAIRFPTQIALVDRISPMRRNA